MMVTLFNLRGLIKHLQKDTNQEGMTSGTQSRYGLDANFFNRRLIY